MRSALNSWLRRWAEASLRTELHQSQERTIRAQEVRAFVEAQLRDHVQASTKRLKDLKRRNVKDRKEDGQLIKALKERMPEDLFLSVAAHVREMQKRNLDK